MPWDHIPDQDFYLYTPKWIQPFDEHLLRRLLAKKDDVFPTPPHKSPHVLIDVLDAFNDDLRVNFRLLDLTQRLDFLEQRFSTFKYLTNLPETQWDMATNTVNATDETWEKIFEDHWLAQAYLRHGEPEYNEMCMLFAPNEIKTEISHTLILISDSPQCKKNSPINLISSSSPEDEVNSPGPPPPAPVVRKLKFVDVDDAMSSVSPVQKKTPHSSILGPAKLYPSCHPSIEVAAAAQKKSESRKDVDNIRYGTPSSCASSSPFK